MSELDLLNFARSCGSSVTSDFAQIITINFAMIVAIYYFLNQAKLRLKIFAFLVYLVGMLMYFAVMVEESNLELATLDALKSRPDLSPLGQRYLAVHDSWLGQTTSALINLAILVLLFGTVYLLFFWDKAAHTPKD